MRLFTDVRGSVRGIPLLVTTAVLAVAQPAGAPTFEVADVHSSPHTLRPQSAGPFYGDGRYELQSVNMLELIHAAYGVDPERVYGGPTWLEIERFDVTAKAPAAPPPNRASSCSRRCSPTGSNSWSTTIANPCRHTY